MFDLTALTSLLNEYAPLELSKKMIEKGSYDNSGVIINSHPQINGVLFALDLTDKVVERAKRLRCDTIVTHHPAIYRPISQISSEDVGSSALLHAIENKMNVISMHLNLDIADTGIDYCLAEALGAKDCKILNYVDDVRGYGREFEIEPTTLQGFVAKAKKNLRTQRVVYYGSKNAKVSKVASFCGGGYSDAHAAVLSGSTDAQVIVSSDMPHHVVKDLVNLDKCVVVLTHFASENYGFKKFYESISEQLGVLTFTCFFEDKRLF